jgi:hypothetical protein
MILHPMWNAYAADQGLAFDEETDENYSVI